MHIDALKLYHFPATRSARALWALYETADCPIAVEKIDLYAGAQFAEGYRAKNPNHNVPALDISWADGTSQTIVESGAIAIFLGDAFPESGLAPPPGPSPARADYLQMIAFVGAQVDMSLWQVRVHEHILPDTERDAETIARYRRKMRDEIEPQLARRLAGGGFICGDAFSLADCMAAHAVSWARGYGLAQDEVFRAYLSRCAKRRAFLKAFADARDFSLAPPKGPAPHGVFPG